jgi:hypothetical protein
MRLFAILCLIAVSLTAPAALADTPAGANAIYRPYNVLLQKTCPDKRLYYLSPADLNDRLGLDFPATLTQSERGRLMRANDEKRRCANSIAGANCANMSMLRAADRTHLLARFVGMLCEKSLACRGQSDCG